MFVGGRCPQRPASLILRCLYFRDAEDSIDVAYSKKVQKVKKSIRKSNSVTSKETQKSKKRKIKVNTRKRRKKDNVSDKINDDLCKNSVNGRAKNFFESKVLLESLEKDLDLPPHTI